MNIVTKDNLNYFWGKVKDKLNTKVDKYLSYKSYENDYMYSSTSNNNCTGYDREFAQVVANDWGKPWIVKMLIKTDMLYNGTTHYPTFHEVLIGVDSVTGTTWVRNFNVIDSTSYRSAHYITVYRPDTAAKANDAPFRLVFRAGDQSSKTAHPRRYDVYIIEAINCTCTLNNELDNEAYQKWYYNDHSTNAYYWSATKDGSFRSINFDISSNGLQETGDADTFAYTVSHYYNYATVGTNGVKRYTIVMQDKDGNYQSVVNEDNKYTVLTKTANTAQFRLNMPMFYYNSSTARNNGARVAAAELRSIHINADMRYSLNVLADATNRLTAYSKLFLVGTIDDDGYFKLDTTKWWAEGEPIEEDGKVYIYLGIVYPDTNPYRCSVELEYANNAYWYKNGAFRHYPDTGNVYNADYNELTNKPTIPSAVTESTVSGWGFTKNTGTYSKPSGGIPKTDLASAVQTSLGKADTALQSYTESDPVFTASPAHDITSADITSWNGKVDKAGDTMSGALNFLEGKFGFKPATAHMDVGYDWDNKYGSGIAFRGSDYSNSSARGDFLIYARNGDGDTCQLVGKPSGVLTWNDKNVVRSVNGVLADENGNVVIESSGSGDNQGQINQLQREINALIKMQGGQIYEYEKASGTAHELTMPSGAKAFDIIELEGVSSITHKSKNLVDTDVVLNPVTSSTKVDNEYWKLNSASLYQRYGNKTYANNPSAEYDLSGGLVISFYARKDPASTVTNVRLTSGVQLPDDSKNWLQERLGEEWQKIAVVIAPQDTMCKLAFSYGSNASINIKGLQVEQATFVSDYYPPFENNYNVEGFEGIKVDANDKIIFNNSDGSTNAVPYTVEYTTLLKEVARYE